MHAETLFLTGSTAAFRQPVFTVAKEGPPTAATSLYISGACNYVCRLFYWPNLDPGGGQDIHLEYAPRWTV
ncbi:hypothetical protein AB0B45_31625 [Nonomuraea sp. NPDC049152]|uniref:hypothetical protein n=1 Tax=Nonomuraea sp. NPDC049152 TaxID=3154350 RepID=UPI0033C66550